MLLSVLRVEYDKYLQPVAWWVLYESDAAADGAVYHLQERRLVSGGVFVVCSISSQF